jgi:hypothetical protein
MTSRGASDDSRVCAGQTYGRLYRSVRVAATVPRTVQCTVPGTVFDTIAFAPFKTSLGKGLNSIYTLYVL